jgi:hypothetical protein
MKHNLLKWHRWLVITLAIITVAATTGFVATLLADKPADYQQLIGWWVRPDGGYVLDIQKAAPDGKLEVVYLNPRPINVSKAQAKINAGQIEVFVELRDKHYPGNYYTLTYDSKMDRLVGVYHQLGIGQKFEVFFSRKHGPDYIGQRKGDGLHYH